MIVVVADASPLIALQQIDQLELLKAIPAVRPHLDTLLRAGFRANPDLVKRILKKAGEEA